MDIVTVAGTVANNTAYSELPEEAGSAYTLTTYDPLYSGYDTSDVESNAILTQPQLIKTFDWAPTDTDGTLLQIIPDTQIQLFHLSTGGFPVNNPLARLLSNYQFFKADIEYTVWCNGNANSTGALMIANRWDRNTNNTTLQNCFCDPNAAVLHAQRQEKLTFIVPYKSAIWNKPGYSSVMNYWGKLYFVVMSPYVNATNVTPPDLNVYVSARFVNIKLAGPTTRVYQGGPVVRKTRGRRPTRQMRKNAHSVKINQLYSQLREIHQKIEHEKRLMQNKVDTSGAKLPDRIAPIRQDTAGAALPGPVPKDVLQSSFKKEAQEVAKVGLNFVKDQIPGSRVALGLAKTVGRFFAPKLVDTLEGWGFNYPLSAEGLTRTKENRYQTLNQDEGSMTAFSLLSQVYDPTEQVDDPMGKDYAEFSNYLSLPSWVDRFQIDTSTTLDQSVAVFPICPAYSKITVGDSNVINPSNLQWLANKFKMWRGSIKYRFHFFVPTGVTASVRISQLPYAAADAGSALPSQDAGSYMSTVVFLSKDTVFDLKCSPVGRFPMKMIPKYPCFSASYTQPCINGILQVTLASSVVNSFAVATTIHCVVTAESDPDDPLRFFGLKDDSGKTYQSHFTPTSGPAPSEIDPPADPMAPVNLLAGDGFTTSDEFHSFKQLMTRGYRATVPSNNFAVDPVTYIPTFIGWTFAAWRGAFRFQPSFDAEPTLNTILANRDFTSMGESYQNAPAAIDVGQIFEMPYSSNVPWREIKQELEYLDFFQEYAKITGVQVASKMSTWFSDDVQLLFPAFVPQIANTV